MWFNRKPDPLKPTFTSPPKTVEVPTDLSMIASMMLIAKQRPPLLMRVEWNDAWGDVPGWVDDDELAEMVNEGCPVITVGWLMQANENYVGLVASAIKDMHFGGLMFIPSKWITRIRQIDEINDER